MTGAIAIPGRTTVLTFENRIGEASEQALFDRVTAQLLVKGFIARGGQIVDATLVPAHRQQICRSEKGLDATWTKMHGWSPFGCKLSINVDKQYNFIRRMATDTAGTHDSRRFDAVLAPGNTSRDVYADRGYLSEERVRS